MRDKIKSGLKTIARWFLGDVLGFKTYLTTKLPYGWDHYAEYYKEEWIPSSKGIFLTVLWVIVLLIACIAWMRGHYADGAVLFYGWIRIIALMCNLSTVDYLDSLNQSQ